MKKPIITVLLSAFMLCGCADNTTPFPTVTVRYQTATLPAPTELPIITNDLPDTPTYNNVELLCETFIETEWGNGANEFGFNKNSSNFQAPGPDSPTFDSQGNMFIADWINKRILAYPKGENTPKIIHIPELYTSEFLPGENLWWSNISISRDRIFSLLRELKTKGMLFDYSFCLLRTMN